MKSDKTFKTEGIILKKANCGEADRILTVFSKHFGKIAAIAKGVRRSSSRKGGNLEIFNQVTIFLVKGKNLDLITEVELLNSFKDWRKDLKKIAVAYQLCELVDKLSAEGVENREVYDLLLDYLTSLSSDADYQVLITNFELSLLQFLGFWPRGKTIGNLNLETFIEELISRKLQSQKFLRRVATSFN